MFTRRLAWNHSDSEFTNSLDVRVSSVCTDSVMALLRELGRGYQALCSYNCREAINILTSLPPQHYNTGWVLTHIGRAYFELAEYTQVAHAWHRVGTQGWHTVFGQADWTVVGVCGCCSGVLISWLRFVGRAFVQRGSQDRVLQSWRDGDLFDNTVALAKRCGPVGAVQRPDRHGQKLSWGTTAPVHTTPVCTTPVHMSLEIRLSVCRPGVSQETVSVCSGNTTSPSSSFREPSRWATDTMVTIYLSISIYLYDSLDSLFPVIWRGKRTCDCWLLTVVFLDVPLFSLIVLNVFAALWHWWRPVSLSKVEGE